MSPDQLVNNGVKFLDYLSALARIGRQTISNIEKNSDWFRYGSQLRNLSTVGIRENEIIDDERAWLTVDRLQPEQPPPVPDTLRGWVKLFDRPTSRPELKPSRDATLSLADVQQRIAVGTVRPENVHEMPDGGDMRAVELILDDDLKVRQTFENYLSSEWEAWAKREKPRRDSIAFYRKLHECYRAMEDMDESDRSIEIVFGLGVAKQYRNNAPECILPVVEQLAEIKMDIETARLAVYPRSVAPTVALLEDKFQNRSGASNIKKALNELDENYALAPWDKETYSHVVATAKAHLADDAQISEDGDAAKDRPVTLTFYWDYVVYVRQRDEGREVGAVVHSFGEQIKRAKDAKKFAELSPTLAEIVGYRSEDSPAKNTVSPSSDDYAFDHHSPPLYLPLPRNEEQKNIVHRLEKSRGGVVVQGPPGTGKSHTIVNIICHYLANGRKVLVTSHAAPALRVLRDILRNELPKEVYPFVIPVFGAESSSKSDIEEALNHLREIHGQSDFDLSKIENRISRLEEKEDGLKVNRCRLERKIKDIAQGQLSRPPEWLCDGLEKPSAEYLARWCAENHAKFSWFVDIPPHSPAESLTVTDNDIARLRDARRELGEDLHYLGKTLPKASDMPAAETVADWHDKLVRADAIGSEIESGQFPSLLVRKADAEYAAERLKENLLRMIDLQQDVASIPWSANFVDRAQSHKVLAELREELCALAKRYEPLTSVSHDDYPAIVTPKAIKILQEKLERKWFSALSPSSRKTLRGFQIKGSNPKNAEDWGQAHAFATLLKDTQQFISLWNQHVGGSAENAPLDHAQMLPWVRSTSDGLTAARELKEREENAAEMASDLLGSATERIGDALALIKHIDKCLSKRRLEKSHEEKEAIVALLNKHDGSIVEEMREFLENDIGGDGETEVVFQNWSKLLESLAAIHQQKPQFDAVAEVTGRLESAGARKWASQLRELPVNDEGADIPENWNEAWRWGCANGYLNSIDAAAMKELTHQLAMVSRDIDKCVKGIVAARITRGLKKSLTEKDVRNLAAFQNAMRRMPIGQRAISAPSIRNQARRALEQCYSVIPCWIMPWTRVNEMLPKEIGAFDLVVVDEASQSMITESLSLLRGKKALVMGDDKQVSPIQIGEFAVLIAQFNQHAGKLPQRDALHPKYSLFDAANILFAGQFVMLKEHFRCAEPIIAFSSRNFYDGNILPLRVPTASERLSPPLVRVYVPEGRRDDNRINKLEARGIIEEIERLVNDPAMSKRTIGIVVLLGSEQVRFILKDLREKIPEDKIRHHEIECGGAAHFQGKERDIMFLSMVADPDNATALTQDVYRQRYNVAVSRARDRVYLFHSVPLERLNNPNDMRRKLLEHFNNPMPGERARELEQLCESKFERTVFRRLTNAGYAVTPQVGSEGYRIDLVVEDESGTRLAIELDGDIFHQDFEKDIYRQQVLERVGWTFWRCFASTYWRNPDGVFGDLLNKLQTMDIKPWRRDDSVVNRHTEVRVFSPPENDTDEESENKETEVAEDRSLSGERLPTPSAQSDIFEAK